MIPRRFSWLFDFLLIVVAFFLAYYSAPALQGLFTAGGPFATPWVARYLSPPTTPLPFPPARDFVWILAAVTSGTILFMELLGGYRHGQRRMSFLVLTDVLAPFMSLGLVALVFFATKQNSWSRLFLFLFGAYSAGALVSFRMLLRSWRHHRAKSGAYLRNVVVAGDRTGVRTVEEHFKTHLHSTDYRLMGWVDVGTNLSEASPEPSIPCLGKVGQLGDLAVHRPIHEVVFIAGDRYKEDLSKVVNDCDYFRLTLRIVPDALLNAEVRDLHLVATEDLVGLPGVVLRPIEFNSDALFLKRLLDIVLSTFFLILLTPLFALIALAIKLTTPRLSVFYRWRVVGQNGREFTGYKFTTMVADADDRKQDLMKYNEMTGPVFKIKEDPRVTRLGKFLRKYSFNELPQFWSVLKGDMSLVGPRPAGPHELVRYQLWHKRKLCVQSGITCLWQVRGRNAITDFDDWVKMDLEYIDNWSLWLDVKIIARTAWVVVRGSGS